MCTHWHILWYAPLITTFVSWGSKSVEAWDLVPIPMTGQGKFCLPRKTQVTLFFSFIIRNVYVTSQLRKKDASHSVYRNISQFREGWSEAMNLLCVCMNPQFHSNEVTSQNAFFLFQKNANLGNDTVISVNKGWSVNEPHFYRGKPLVLAVQ